MLRMSISPPLAAALLKEVVGPYMRRYPHVDVEVDASTRTVDLAREGYDLALRVGPLPDSALTVRRLGSSRGGYYASPAYVARRGVPQHPDELVDHDTIVMPRGDRMARWHFASGRRKRTVVIRPRILVSSFELGLEAAIAGLGIMPSTPSAVRSHVAKKRLVPVLASWTATAFEVNVLFVPGSAGTPKTRRMIDALSAWFASQKKRV